MRAWRANRYAYGNISVFLIWCILWWNIPGRKDPSLVKSPRPKCILWWNIPGRRDLWWNNLRSKCIFWWNIPGRRDLSLVKQYEIECIRWWNIQRPFFGETIRGRNASFGERIRGEETFTLVKQSEVEMHPLVKKSGEKRHLSIMHLCGCVMQSDVLYSIRVWSISVVPIVYCIWHGALPGLPVQFRHVEYSTLPCGFGLWVPRTQPTTKSGANFSRNLIKWAYA